MTSLKHLPLAVPRRLPPSPRQTACRRNAYRGLINGGFSGLAMSTVALLTTCLSIAQRVPATLVESVLTFFLDLKPFRMNTYIKCLRGLAQRTSCESGVPHSRNPGRISGASRRSQSHQELSRRASRQERQSFPVMSLAPSFSPTVSRTHVLSLLIPPEPVRLAPSAKLGVVCRRPTNKPIRLGRAWRPALLSPLECALAEIWGVGRIAWRGAEYIVSRAAAKNLQRELQRDRVRAMEIAAGNRAQPK